MLVRIHLQDGSKLDVTPYIDEGGYKFALSDLDNNSGRTIDGKMWREFIGRKAKIGITFRDEVPTSVCVSIFSALKQVYVTMDYFDTTTGKMETAEFYNTEKVATCVIQKNGTEYWSGISLSLIER